MSYYSASGSLQAYLNRAVQLLDTTCREQGISESAVAQKLRGRGMDLDTLKGRAAEVARGIAGAQQSNKRWAAVDQLIGSKTHLLA